MRASFLQAFLVLSIFTTITGIVGNSNVVLAQEGTKQFIPNSETTERLWPEFQVFDGNNFGMYGCTPKERINIRLRAGEKMYFGMKMNYVEYTGDVRTNPDYISFRVMQPNGTVEAFEEQGMVQSGDAGYIGNYNQAKAGPTGVKLNGTPISGGYTPLSFTAPVDGDYFIEFEGWDDTYGSHGNSVRRRRFALQYFDVTVTDAANNIITNPGEPNKSAGRLWSRGWTFTTTSFTRYPVNANFFVYTLDEFINKVNFKMYPYSFTFVVNSFGLTTTTTKNYIERAQSSNGDQTTGVDISEYRVFLNDPDRSEWKNTKLAPPKVKVWSEGNIFMDYDYMRNPLYLPIDITHVVMEKNMPGCLKEDVAIFKIESNNDGFTAILIDINKDGAYSTGGSDRVIYRNMKKGLNYVLWNFTNDAGAEVAFGDYNASATFLGRGPANFPLYDVEQMDGLTTASIRPFNKLKTTNYWDDTYISRWGDASGKMNGTQQKQLVLDKSVPRIWSWIPAWEFTPHNGNMNTMNTWFHALDLGYSSLGIRVEESATKCVDGLAPWVGDIYKEGPKNTDLVFTKRDFTYKFFDPREYTLDSIQVISIPNKVNGILKLSGSDVTEGQIIKASDLGNLTFTPTTGWFGKEPFLWKGHNSDPTDDARWSDNQENVYCIINTPPVITDIPDQTLCTNTPTGEIAFTISDAEHDLSSIQVTGFSADPSFVPNTGVIVTMGSTPNERKVKVTPVANKSGMAIIYLMADDGLSQSFEEFTVYVGPDLQFSGDTTVCVNQALDLTAQETGAAYSWRFKDTDTEVSTTQSLHQNAGSVSVGSWSLTVTKGICSSTRNFMVTVSPSTSFTGDLNVCVGEALSLSATEVNASYSWVKVGDGEKSTFKTFSISSVATADAGNYTLYVDKDGCTNTSSPFTISVKDSPNTGLVVSGNAVDPDKNGTITISSAQNAIVYNVYKDGVFVATGTGTGGNLLITIPSSSLSIGDNIFVIKASNGNCEVTLLNTGTIHVNIPGITVTQISSITTESGGTATFTIGLNTEPSSNVTINLTSSNTNEGTVSSSVIFTSTDWAAKTITVTGINDDYDDGDIPYTINISPAISSDANYSGKDPDDLSFTNTDNDAAGVVVSAISGNTTEAGSGTATFTIELACKPSSDVTIDINSSDLGEGTVAPSAITIIPADWNNPQLVTVTGVNDDIDDGDQNYTIVTSATRSTDAKFDGLEVADVTVLNIDDDDSGINASAITGHTTEVGGTATYSVWLNSEPTYPVTITSLSDDASEGTVSDGGSLTFTASDWSTHKTVTVKGVDDYVADGNQPYTISLATGSTDPNYNGIPISKVNVVNDDDDIVGLDVSELNLTTSEPNVSDNFTVKLKSQPTADVKISVTSSITTEGTVSVSELTFIPSEWNILKPITVTGVDDDLIDGSKPYIVTLDVIAGDASYMALSNVTINAINNDNDVAGIYLSKGSLTTTEGGVSESFDVRLTARPSSNVVLNITGLNTGEGTLSKSSLTFEPDGWNVLQAVTVTGVNDFIADGNKTYSLVIAYSSGDAAFAACTRTVDVTNRDDDAAGVTVSPATLTTTEGGSSSFTIALNTQPTSDVRIDVSSADLTEGTVSPASLTFTSTDWAAKTITVSGVVDNEIDGNITYNVNIAAAVSSDGNYNDKFASTVSVTNNDVDVAGLIFTTPTTGLVTTENGGTATFSFKLTSKPTSTVNISVVSNDTGEGTVSPSVIAIIPANWNSTQTVTITGVDDNIDDSNQNYTVSLTTSSGDSHFSGLPIPDVQATNNDNGDVAGIVVSVDPLTTLTTTEASGASHTAIFTITLHSQPTADVVINLSSSNTDEGTVSPSSLTFGTGDWNSLKTVTITGVDDLIDDGDVDYSIITAAAVSADGKYSGMDANDVKVKNIDNDNAGVTVTAISGHTTELGGTATYTVKLNTKPTGDVIITSISDDATEGTISIGGSLTFTTTDWATPKTVTVRGIDDFVADGNQAYTISLAANSTDSKYNSIPISKVNAINDDNDVVGVIVSKASLETSEPNIADNFNVKLKSQPLGTVTITISSDKITEGIVSPNTLTFDDTNWNVNQLVTVTGQDDFVDEADYIDYNVKLHTTSSVDPFYNAITDISIPSKNKDNDDAGIIVSAISNSTSEAGVTATFTVRLNSQPTNDVSIKLSSSNINEGIVTAVTRGTVNVPGNEATITFTPSQWNSAVTVTVKGVDDDVDDNDIAYSIITNPTQSVDAKYNNVNPLDVSITNIDNDTWGINVTPTSLSLNENGAAKTFNIVLQSRPTDKVTIGLSSNNIQRVTVSPATIEFTNLGDSWKTPIAVTVTPVNNSIDDGDILAQIITARAVSTDVNYTNKKASDVDVTVANDDLSGVNVSAVSGNTSEKGTTATFNIALNTEPTADVTISISSDDTSEGTVSLSSVTFTSLNWNTPVSVTVTGVDDLVADGNQTYHIVIGAAVSGDLYYSGVDPADITMINSDDDSPGITVFPISGLTTNEAGLTTSFTVCLNSQPTSDVSINLSSSDITEGTIDKSSLTFTAGNWNTKQVVTITGVDDLVEDGDIPYIINLDNAVSTDPGYSGRDVQDVSVTNMDDIGPRLVDDAITTNEDSQVNIPVLANDKGLDKGGLVLSISQQPSHGTLVIEADNTVTYKPDGLFNGSDTFIYKVCDHDGNCDEATVTITVTWMDDQPVALDDARGASKNTPVNVDVLFNDHGLEDGGIVVSIEELPTQGTAVRNPDNTVTYTPSLDFIGISTFKYRVTDVDGDYAIAKVTINVRDINHIPVASDDAAITAKNIPVEISVLANDAGLEDGFIRLSSVMNPSHGSVAINSHRTIIYTPSADFIGNDSFKYMVEDVDGDYDIATVSVTVTESIDHLPIANADRCATEYKTVRNIDVLANDTGLEDGVKSVVISSSPVNGIVIVNTDHTITYTPNDGFSGVETFGYQVSDNDDDRATANVTVTVLPEGTINHLPVAVDDAATTIINTPVDISVLANDTGLDDGFGLLRIYADPKYGTAVVNPNRTITYTPSYLFVGTDNLKYWVEDIHGDKSIATVSITVTEKPDYLPVANDDRRATEYITPVKVDVLTNDTGLEDGGIVVSITTAPDLSKGVAVANSDNTVTFTPAAEFSGTATFIYTVVDKDSDSDDATVTITVLPEGVTNHVPVAANDNATTIVNTPVEISVLANDTGLEDGFGLLRIHAAPSHGTTTINANRTITYTPSNLYVGTDNFQYWVEDIHGDKSIATVTITVTDKPDYLPVANDDRCATEYQIPRNIDVLTNDTGLDDGGIVVTITTTPAVSEGTAVVIGDNTVTFTPAPGYSGISTFGYTVTDKDGDSDDATVTIAVLPEGVTNHVPLAANDNATTIVNTPVEVSVLANDTGLEDGFGLLRIHAAPSHGTTTINANRTITYTPSNLFIGIDNFQYWVEDIHGDKSIATVTINVIDKPNYIPVANDDSRGASFNASVNVDVLINDTGLEDGGIKVSVSVSPDPLKGTAIANPDNTITFTPTTGFIGLATFQYKVEDKDGDWDDATVTIKVKEGINIVPVAVDDAVTTTMNKPVIANILSNDSGLEDGIKGLIIYRSPKYGSVIVNSNLTVTYTPSQWFVGSDSFDYMVSDVDGDYDIATVVVTVNSIVNSIPVANDDSRGTSKNTSRIVDVLVNDTGLDDGGIKVSVSVSPDPLKGTAVANPDNKITFTPATDYIGLATFQYKVEDKDGDWDDATVTINVKEVNYIPQANDDLFYTNINTTGVFDVLDNDLDLEDGGIKVEILDQVIAGKVTVNADNTISYTPLTGFAGTDYFSYKVTDIDGDYDVANVTVIVTSGTIPGFVVTPLSVTTSEDGANGTISVALSTAPATDVTISLVSEDETEGTVVPATLTYTPSNWSVAQIATVTGVNDNIIDGSITYNVKVGIVDALSDDTFDPLFDQIVAVTNTDNDAAGFTLSKTTATTSEALTTDNFTVVLNAQPNSDVVISAVSSDITEGTVSPESLTFTSSNWNIPQQVTITGVSDLLVDGNITYNVTLSVVDVSSDDNFDPLADQSVAVTNIDNNPPVAVNDEIVINEGEANVTGNVVENDSDVDGNQLSVSQINGSSNISATTGKYGALVCEALGSYTYSLDESNEFVKALNNGGTLVDTFTYIVTDGFGGYDTALLAITINGYTNIEDINIPKGFSPDGNGIGDRFVIGGIENYPDNELIVYNRWGTEVYRKKHYNNEWDGTSTNKSKLPVATYFYVLTVTGKSGPFRGYVYIKY